MPGVYRKKNCPQCGVEHRGRGQFCSQACSNKHREVKPETREKLKAIAQDHAAQTSARVKKEAEDLRKKKRGEYVLQEDDWYVLPEGDGVDDDGLVL